MRITIFGTGYVGLVTGACFAEAGNQVLCIDIDEHKVRRLQSGESLIHEPGLDALVPKNVAAGRLTFSTSAREGVAHGTVLMIAVGTPQDEDGSADLRHVLAVARSIGEYLDGYRVIIDKSTVPVGTADQVRAEIERALLARGVSLAFDVVSNPEFLKEGAAVADFMKPDRVVVGTDSASAADVLRTLYEPFTRSHERLLVMDVRSAELTKYAANAMLATKISFINELSQIAERVGADIEKVRKGIGSDSRIGYSFIYPGMGYGGSCFPKDIKALTQTARSVGVDSVLLRAVDAVNQQQKQVLFGKISEFFQGSLRGRCVALWGLAFKPDTDDMREAPSRVLMRALWDAGATVRAYDPVASHEAARLYPAEIAAGQLVLAVSSSDALEGADVLAIATEWREFRSPDFSLMVERLRLKAVFDGRNMYEPAQLAKHGLIYHSIGRPVAQEGVSHDHV